MIEELYLQIVGSVDIHHRTQVTKQCPLDKSQWVEFQGEGGVDALERKLIDHYGHRVRISTHAYGSGKTAMDIVISPKDPDF